MKKINNQKDNYPADCLTCGKPTKKSNSYCSPFCRRKFVFMGFENGKAFFTKTDNEIINIIKNKILEKNKIN